MCYMQWRSTQGMRMLLFTKVAWVISEDLCFLFWIDIVNTVKPKKNQLWQFHPGLVFFSVCLQVHSKACLTNILWTGREVIPKYLPDTDYWDTSTASGLIVCISSNIDSELCKTLYCGENKCSFLRDLQYLSCDCFASPVNSPDLYWWNY